MRYTWPLAVCLTLGTALAYGAEVTSRDFYDLIRRNDLTQLKSVIASGANVNVRDTRGSTPLMHAAAIGSIDALKVLLAAGADVNAKNGLDTSALIYGALDPAKARLLVEAGAEVNVVSKVKRTPLLVAAGSPGSIDTVRLLLSKGADTKAADVRGNTALLEAARVNDIEMLRVLLKHPVDLNAGDFAGLTALTWAAGHGNLPAVKLLLEKGADLNASHQREIRVKNGLIAVSKVTPLMGAAPRSPVEVSQTLLAAGADVNAKDMRGMTPLMFAVASDAANARTVRLLLDHGADRSAKSLNGETALDWARKFGQPDVLRLLGGTVAEAKIPLKPVAESHTDARSAATQAMTLLQTTSTEYFKQSGCVGCHHQNLTAVAAGSLRHAGLAVNEKAIKEQMLMVKSELLGTRDTTLQGIFISTDGLSYSLLQLAQLGYPADEVTDGLVATIAGQQKADGSWSGLPVVRPPLEDSDVVRTALNAHSLARYTIPARQAEFDGRIAKARQWLLEARPDTNYDRAYRLLGLKWLGADSAAIEQAAAELSRLQSADGGWQQISTLPADAYATGLSLYALRKAGMAATDATYARGVRFLLASQKEDGSWHVASRAPKVQPYFQSGFPHNHDQWISAAATAWAAAALADSVAPAPRSAALR